jgi:predicted P-loop ATPase
VRDWLVGLKWDGTPRLSTWLARACLEEDEWDVKRDPLHAYLARAGTFYLMAMCARVLEPGTKFDYMLILEGAQGMRKSTLLRTLAGDYFADTGLVLGDKDSFQQLQGRWLYEIAELDGFSKADVLKIKAYVASSRDYFRASFDRRAREYPRQVVFGGTTNEDHYLVDPTGNRRFWPVRVTRLVDIDWVQEHRGQLFAEAMARLAAGKRMYPTPEEELELFVPQQQQRTVENAIETAIARFLYPPEDVIGQAGDGSLVTECTLVELLGKVGIGIEKLGPGRFHEKQAGAALRRLGWTEARSNRPGRPRVYKRPPRGSETHAGGSQTFNAPHAGEQPAGVADDCPF